MVCHGRRQNFHRLLQSAECLRCLPALDLSTAEGQCLQDDDPLEEGSNRKTARPSEGLAQAWTCDQPLKGRFSRLRRSVFMLSVSIGADKGNIGVRSVPHHGLEAIGIMSTPQPTLKMQRPNDNFR
jgi:hypothetical protein